MKQREVLVESDPALPLIYVAVAQNSGAAEDPSDREGLTRLTARLMRRTGGGLSADELDARVDLLGSTLGVDTGYSSAGFSASVISRSFDDFLSLMLDVLGRPGFAREEFERLKRETATELTEVLDHDRSLVRRWFRRKLFANHAYGRSAVGSRMSLDRISQRDVREHYQRTFVANNLTLAFAGDISEERAVEAARRIRQALKQGESLKDRTGEPEGPKGRHLVIVDKPERTQTQILIGGLGTKATDDDHHALTLANAVFGGAFTARLTQEVRAKRGWSYGAFSSLPYDRRRQAFSMWTFPKAGDAAPCIRLQLDMLGDWVERGVTQEELEWAKRYLVRSHAFSIDTAAKRVGLELDELVHELPAGYHHDYPAKLEDVTLAQANAAIRRRIKPNDIVITVVGTEAQIGAAVRDSIPDLSQAEVVPFDAD